MGLCGSNQLQCITSSFVSKGLVQRTQEGPWHQLHKAKDAICHVLRWGLGEPCVQQAWYLLVVMVHDAIAIASGCIIKSGRAEAEGVCLQSPSHVTIPLHTLALPPLHVGWTSLSLPVVRKAVVVVMVGVDAARRGGKKRRKKKLPFLLPRSLSLLPCCFPPPSHTKHTMTTTTTTITATSTSG